MPGWSHTQNLARQVGRGVHSFTRHNFRLALFTESATIDRTVTEYRGLEGEVFPGFGYVRGGFAIEPPRWLQGCSSAYLVSSNVSVTARGRAIEDIRYAVIYNDSLADKDILAYASLNATETLAIGARLTLDLNTLGTFAIGSQGCANG